MKKQKKNVYLLFFLLLPLNLFSQLVTNFATNPSVVYDTTSFDLIISCSFPNGACDLHTQNHSVFGSIVSANAIHCLGSISGNCTTTDTFHISHLTGGVYTFSFDLSYSLDSSTCIPIAGQINYTNSFVVQFTTKVDELEKYFTISISRGAFIFHNVSKNNELVIYNVVGKEIFRKQMEANEELNMSTFPFPYLICALIIDEKRYIFKYLNINYYENHTLH